MSIQMQSEIAQLNSELEETDDPREGYVKVQAKIRGYRQAGMRVPDDLALIEKRLRRSAWPLRRAATEHASAERRSAEAAAKSIEATPPLNERRRISESRQAPWHSRGAFVLGGAALAVQAVSSARR